ncbi:MAG: glycosyltransferase [Oscillospiraceae bacterium]|jgi:GT2 family glycosyltransferase|nr:glycosyltransferase [Oscillospiraceae bacterium]
MSNNLLFEILQTGDEALEYIGGSIGSEDSETCLDVAKSLTELYENIAVYIENNNIVEKHRGYEAALNTALAVEKLCDALENNDLKSAAFFYTYELVPLHVFLARELNFWFAIYPDMNKMREFRDIEFDNLVEYKRHHKETLETEYKYDVSIMVLCYGKVEYTKIAVNSLLKYTDFERYKVEIIVVNNGSNDNGETSEYLKSIKDKHIKTIELKHPLGYNAYSLGPIAALGRYFIEFHSDVVATENWLNNLMDCITSDYNIGAVVATCNWTSNYQIVTTDYKDPKTDDTEMQIFAAKHNKSNSSKWEDRAAIIPTSGYLVPTILYRHLLRDPWFYYGQFTDDDMAVFLRRSEFRQIVAKDTFLHHFGSITSTAEVRENNSLLNMRERFYSKWGVDAWSSRELNSSIYNYIKNLNIDKQLNILFIDPMFCTIVYFMKKYFDSRNITLNKIAAIVTNNDYTLDAKVIFDEVYSGELKNTLPKLKDEYDYIFFTCDIEEYINEGFSQLLSTLHSVISEKTRIVFTLKNPGYYKTINEFLDGEVDPDAFNIPWKGLRFIDPMYVYIEAVNVGFKCNVNNILDTNIKHSELKRLDNIINQKKNTDMLKSELLIYTLSK